VLRASIAAEIVGIPSVSIVCDGFAGQARATARGHGFDGLPVAVTVGHVDAQSADEMIANFVRATVPQIIDGLTSASSDAPDDTTGSAVAPASVEPAALDIVANGTIDDINRIFRERGWSDGNAAIPPTIDRVNEFLADSGHDPFKSLGIATSSGRDLTIWSIAVNAVMAGCLPHHLPVLIALTNILADPAYGAEHSGNTTGADALIVLDGVNAAALGFSSGPGAMREGVHANTVVARWLRLYLRNVFDFTADEHDRATFGNAARVVLTEDLECLVDIGWEPLSSAFGFGLGDDVVTMARMNSGTIIGSVVGSTPDEIVPYLANGLVRVTAWDLTHIHGLGHDQYQPLLVISPLIARTCARSGWSKRQLQQALFVHARIPAITFERFIGQWSNLTAGRPQLTDLVASGVLPRVFAESNDPNRLVPIVTAPERILIAVAGDPNRANAYALSNDGPHGWWTAKEIDHTPASDLICSVDGSCAPG
jgi:hypothetical protein